MKNKIKSVLIANRGEIAIRIARTAKKMGIKTFMFMTHEEPNATYLKSADEIIDVTEETFYNIFTNVNKIIESALKYNIDAIHPGYGFLSENPALARECLHNNIVFIGPSHQHIDQMGNKGVARDIAIKNNVPVLPGSTGVITSLAEAEKIAASIGYPVIVKAVAGGGGKGMRVAYSEDDLPRMFNAASREAMSVFGNAAVFIEKYVENPRHIEFQVLADQHGNVVHLFERECSIQRKHQKLLEEAPSPALDEETRNKMGQDAVRLCKATGYYSVGTVEFLVDEHLNHFFMEMNTRIQVEHPVTEEITGIDLIEQQFRVANGEKLSFTQKDITRKGCAIEFRINAEDVQADFTPDNGIVETIKFPRKRKIRVDSGYVDGDIIPSCYDSLIAKLIVKGADRKAVLKTAISTINNIKIKGVKTTLPFFKMVLNNEAFKQGNYSTSFIETELEQNFYQEDNELVAAILLGMTKYLNEINSIDNQQISEKNVSPWRLSRFFK
ncbi:acetyl-CoA carboxylase biotin carboxylase subunit [Thermophagus xiamenensis]|uniref:biotin carboxylase n=1 Tax=Thermophagus xiamenensis TaxID=385682 RepID=A0A1I1WAP8_9BACT|nr:biotin carboxylase N-terminal domain-containing protein [Thermophagus xiamenensis]SFD92227.1 acetyl-CoA carboxylase, biotin carboxylase subunit/propionyl-CoA carboxylase alpha chain [Thermophagus xiamenensis]